MSEFTERSAYPSPDDFRVMRPEYAEPSEEGGDEDELVRAAIVIAPFRVSGESRTKAGARRAALYEAEKTYHSYHPSYRVESPFPDEFTDTDGTVWKRVPAGQREKLGDYTFTTADGEEDSADIESMLVWDVRPVEG
jgi:hypothetical protein